jgi:hypothetical protein
VERAGPHRLDDCLIEHQVRDIRGRDDHALRAIQAAGLADGEEALDLACHAANRLHLAMLVHRAGDGDPLRKWQVRQRRQQGAVSTSRACRMRNPANCS